MQLIDIILLIILGIAGVTGFRKGFIAQIAMFVALLLGIWACLHLADHTAAFLTQHFDFAKQSTALWAFLVTFALTVLLVYLLGRLVTKTIRILLIGWLDRLLGLLFSILKVALIISVLISALSYGGVLAHVVSTETQQKSLLFKPIQRFAPAIYPTIRRYWQSAMQQIAAPEPNPQQ